MTKIKVLLILVGIPIFMLMIYSTIEKEMMPTVMNIAAYKINTVATGIINRAVAKTLNEVELDSETLVKYYYNDQGEIVSWGLDTVTINQLTSNIMANISEDIEMYDVEVLKIPLGNMLGKSTFSDWGPLIEVNIMPQGTANINYDREFVAAGINQINHRVWLNVEMRMKVMIPLDEKEVIVNQKITLVDRLLKGKIPDSYVVVPEESVLDVTE